ncbi:MAG: class I SAM-dependent methyltransferase [Saprospiraceae bacterium]|nr:class I SAM-dependent methyltransferase [Saprospiraceae bacterium]MBP7644927.1 class I SAM-dependent methyltransferase [Saprospiraceae bacterium]
MITDPEIDLYIDQYKTQSSSLLLDLERATHLQVLAPQMLSGQTQGNLLSILSTMMRPQRVLEIGTYTGFSAICLAEGLSPHGLLYTIDVNNEIEDIARKYIERSPKAAQIQFLVGDAKTIIPTLKESWDLVFIDADKESYSLYYEMVVDQVRPGGIILADNVLWYGKVVQEEKDKKTRLIHEFNVMVSKDHRVKNVILPLRDGINVIQKL